MEALACRPGTAVSEQSTAPANGAPRAIMSVTVTRHACLSAQALNHMAILSVHPSLFRCGAMSSRLGMQVVVASADLNAGKGDYPEMAKLVSGYKKHKSKQ